MSAAERDFSDFYLGDNVYQLANGLVPEIAEKLQVTIAGEPSSDDLQAIMSKVGTNKVLRNNAEVTAIERDEVVDIVDRSGVQKPLWRSLWSPEAEPDDSIGRIIAFGGVANWQDRTRDIILDSSVTAPTHLLGGDRVMDTGTEVTNSDVIHLYEKFGRYPTEAEYASSMILPRLWEFLPGVLATAYATKNADEIIARSLEQNPGMPYEKLMVARVANAGIAMALQVRKGVRDVNPDFDADPMQPDMYVMTDTFPLARTDEEEKKPAEFQKPGTALRQVVLTAKMLHEADV